MRKIITAVIIVFALATHIFSYIIDYDVKGSAIGGTKLKGNMKVLMKSKAKRITGNIFYQEAGRPFPDLDEKEIIVDFTSRKKHIFTMESGGWFSSPLDEDFSSLNDSDVKISVKKTPKEITAVINVDLDPVFGGKQKYTIKLSFKSSKPGREVSKLKRYGKPTGIGFLSLFIDNEKVIDMLAKKLGDDAFRFPDKFNVTIHQGENLMLNIDGELQVKLALPASSSAFKPK